MIRTPILLVLQLVTLQWTGQTLAQSVPDQFDWRQVPEVVSEVQDQGDCDSGYAYATVGLLEGQQVKIGPTTSERLVPLSAQNIIDCSRHNRGCQGGAPDTALDDLFELGGIESDQSYPRTSLEGRCKFNKRKSIMRPLNFLELPSGHEEIMKQKIADYGPLAVRIEVTENLIRNYKGGVFSDTNCTGTKINHSVLIVGYGEDPLDGDYWLMKNSWGKQWGESGYFRLKRGVNMCSVALYPTLTIFGHM